MSSSYHILCVSHDPGIYAIEDVRKERLEHFLTSSLEDHQHCDLLVLRRSGGLVEVGCPGTLIKDRNSDSKCLHNEIKWERVEWLRLLRYTQMISPVEDPYLGKLRGHYEMRCWNHIRIHRLRLELSLGE